MIARRVGSVETLVDLATADMAGVDAIIIDRMQSPVSVIPVLADHIIRAGGKRLRPLITVTAARLAGGRGDTGQKLAAAVEFIHTATLLHDDVVDGSGLRRGKIAAHLIWGAPSSVLVGDFLFARAFELMVETGSMRAMEILARAARVIAEGEVLQLSRAHDVDLSRETYLEIISAKTAALFAAAAESGAVLAGKDDGFVRGFQAYGENLGIAFQLVDDALDYSGRQALMGKNVGDDFREAKMTLPIILAHARADAESRAFWKRVIETANQTEADLNHAITLVEETGAIQETMRRARSYADAAKTALGILPASPIKSALSDIADFCVERAY
jgi:octaprenyl-diphosphate synthase